MGETTTADHGGRGRRRPGSHGGGWSRRAELAARTGGLRAALARGRAADPGGPALLLPPGPAPSQQGLRLQPAPHPRGPQRLHPAAQRAEEARALLQGGEHRLTKLGKGFFRDKYYEYLVHVPVIIRGRRRTPGGLRAQGLAAGERAGRGHDEAPGTPHGGAGGAAGETTSGGLAWETRAAPSCSSRTRPTSLTLRGTGWSAPRARSIGTPGPRWRRSYASG